MCIVGKDLLNSTHILTHPQGKKKPNELGSRLE